MTNPLETFSTDRLILRRPVPNDAEAVFAYASDSEVMRYLPRLPSTDIAESRAFLERCERVWETHEALVWAITLNQGMSLIGMIEGRLSAHGVELGYVLNRPWWGNGYMTEAAGPVIEWALGEPDVHRVWAYTDVDNQASQRVLERLEMQREGTLHRWMTHPTPSDAPSDAFMYAIWK